MAVLAVCGCLLACGGSGPSFASDACTASAELCNGVDDDCDGVVDEAPEADESCGDPALSCAAGECGPPSCGPEEADCDGMAANGCEVDLSSTTTSCGACGHSCRAGMPCVHGICGEDRLALAAGDRHSCAVTPRGRVRCWGSNVRHELGDGTMLARGEPVDVAGVEDAVDVAVSDERSCAVLASGGISCWGGEHMSARRESVPSEPNGAVLREGAGEAVSVALSYGRGCAVMRAGGVECWDTDVETRQRSVAISGVDDAVEVAVSGRHSCVLRATGRVLCWGENDLGQLGDGTREPSESPVEVVGLEDAIHISAAADHTCAVRADGILACWGGSLDGSLAPGRSIDVPTPVPGIEDATQVSVGWTHYCALRRDGRLACWGTNFDGESGAGNHAFAEPTHMVGDVGEVFAFAVSRGLRPEHSCAMAPDGSVKCWGDGSDGQIGDGETRFMSRAPVLTDDLGSLAAAVSVSGRRACVVRPSGAVACWGGFGERQWPLEISGVSGALEVSVGGTVACAVSSDSSGQCWAADATGTGLAAIPGVPVIKHVALGFAHRCLLGGVTSGAASRVYCWGDGSFGQLGDGRSGRGVFEDSPLEVVALPPSISLAAGEDHACAVSTTGAVWCWGANDWGQGGDSMTTALGAPHRVPGLAGAVQVTAGSAHTCALLETGRVMCWGLNGAGQLGVASDLVAVRTPVEVPGLEDVRKVVAAGPDSTGPASPYASYLGGFTCALRNDGTVWCWGANPYGQLGDGTRESRADPRVVTGIADVVDISAGTGSACAVTRTGKTYCWGWNFQGLLGTSQPVMAFEPAQVVGLP